MLPASLWETVRVRRKKGDTPLLEWASRRWHCGGVGEDVGYISEVWYDGEAVSLGLPFMDTLLGLSVCY